MITLHAIEGATGRSGLEDAVLSCGIIDPLDPLAVYDFGLGAVIQPPAIIAFGSGDPAAVSFAPAPELAAGERLAANLAEVIRLRPRKKPRKVSEGFRTGYTEYARDAALFWRQHGIARQPALAAGVFSLSSIRTPIVTTLRLFSMLMPHVIDDQLPGVTELSRIVKRSGAGLVSTKTGRPRWYAEYDRFRDEIVAVRNDEGLVDDALRRVLALDEGLPTGLGLAKLSFTLALLGSDLGCLDARILGWAYAPATRERIETRINKKKPDGTVTESVYQFYRRAEVQVLARMSPFHDPGDPVGLARSQWMLWESLGPPGDQTHTHEELFEAVVDEALFEEMLSP